MQVTASSCWLAARIYAGQIAIKGQPFYPGQHLATDRCRDLERGSRSARRQYESQSSKSNAAEPSLLAGLLVDARCPSRAPYYITRRQERAALFATRWSLPRRSPAGTDLGQG